MKRCTQCGATIEAKSKLCEYCGAHVEPSELESVLGFHEDRDKRILEDKRREADAARAAREAEQKRKYTWDAWTTGVAVLLLIASILAIGSIGQHEKRGTTPMPLASRELKGRNYQAVKTDLQAAGFTSVETTALPDLKVAWWKKGEVAEVSVNGETDWSDDSRFPTDARILIRYHVFPERKK